MTKYLRSRCSGGGGRFEFRQAFIKLLPAKLEAVPEGLFADIDIYRDDYNVVFFDLLAWQIAGTVGDNPDGHVFYPRTRITPHTISIAKLIKLDESVERSIKIETRRTAAMAR